ncbi:unnamed protein product, partial [Acidithrix sp. C25]
VADQVALTHFYIGPLRGISKSQRLLLCLEDISVVDLILA